ATADELLRRADVAMYVAKARGKSGRVLFDQAMQDTVVKRLALTRDLQFAVDRDELVVHYQPTIALDSGRIVGMEALVRWRHPERGLLAPDEFIRIAEDTGLILQIGRWVLTEACTRMRGWQERFPSDPPLAIAVNVSIGQVHQPGLAGVVAAALQASALAPRSLVLEITESVVVEDAALALRRLRELKKLGVRLAIDDFGTGYSSLNYLRRFPVDFLKIDKSFIDKIGRRKEQDVVRTVVDLGHRLGMAIVGEGIQRPEQAERLRALNCDIGQGYHFGRPMPAEEMEEFLEAADASLRITARAAA
ncbi:MAG: GGDEF domain-containing protein, partial [Dehalococcoidia bacterium]